MSLRTSENVLRMLVGLALGFGFLGFATQGRAVMHANKPVAPVASPADRTALHVPGSGPATEVQLADCAGVPAAVVGLGER